MDDKIVYKNGKRLVSEQRITNTPTKRNHRYLGEKTNDDKEETNPDTNKVLENINSNKKDKMSKEDIKNTKNFCDKNKEYMSYEKEISDSKIPEILRIVGILLIIAIFLFQFL